jgi:plasmid stabilization system protein ParE
VKVHLLPQAQEDLDAVRDPLFSRIIKQLQALEDFPELGAAMAGPFLGWRSFVVDFFRVVYRVSSDRIEVGYVRDCRRKPLTQGRKPS